MNANLNADPDDRTEAMIRQAFAAEADRAPDPAPVLAALAAGRRRRRPALTLVVAASVAVAVVVAVAAVLVPQVVQRAGGGLPAAGGPPAHGQNLLLVGPDEDGHNDSIMLVHLGEDGQGAVLSLPRDAWVRVPGGDHMRLNAVEKELGTEAMRETVGDLTGVVVDHYAVVSAEAVRRISGLVGGVPVCLREDTTDPLSGASFLAGPQLVYGQDALSFLRQRHGLDEGELDRMRRQQAFVHGLVSRIADGAADLDRVAEAVRAMVRLEPGWDLLETVELLRAAAPDRIRFGTIPVDEEPVETPDRGVALGVDPETVRAYVDEAVNGGPEVVSEPPPYTPASAPQDGTCVD